MEEYKRIVEKIISEEENFSEVCEIVRMNSLGGNIWAVGSFLYKNILRNKYGMEGLEVEDYDFILENLVDYGKENVPDGWKMERTHFGSPRMKKENLQIDIIPLYGLKEKITEKEYEENDVKRLMSFYLERVPFEVQSISYEVNLNSLMERGSINAIQKRESKIFNIKPCEEIAKDKGISLEEYFKYKSKKLGVKILY